MTRKPEPDPYSVLGVGRAASDAEIRAAYRALVAKYHPDRHQGNPLEELASERMAEINRAHEILSDPARRAAYDSAGASAAGLGPGYPPGSISRKHARWLQIVALLFMLPLLIRFGSLLVRQLVRLVRAALEITSLTRGTPLVAGLVFLAVALLVVVLVRQQRTKRNSRNSGKRI
jgi:hypothetical protein